jgi:hypothetical protein
MSHVTLHKPRTPTAIPASIASLVLYQRRKRVAVRVCARGHVLSVDMHRKLGVQQDAAVCKCVSSRGGGVIDSNVLHGWRWHAVYCVVEHVLCTVVALHVRVQATTPTRLKPFLSRLSMRTAPSKRIARARHAFHCCVRCARHVHCVGARMCIEQLLHRTARDALTVQTFSLIALISRNVCASSPSPPTPLACTVPGAPG